MVLQPRQQRAFVLYQLGASGILKHEEKLFGVDAAAENHETIKEDKEIKEGMAPCTVIRVGKGKPKRRHVYEEAEEMRCGIVVQCMGEAGEVEHIWR